MFSRMVKTAKPFIRPIFGKDNQVVGQLTIIAIEIFPDEEREDLQEYISDMIFNNALCQEGRRHAIGLIQDEGDEFYRLQEVVFKPDAIIFFPIPKEALEMKWDIMLDEVIDFDPDSIDSISPFIYQDETTNHRKDFN